MSGNLFGDLFQVMTFGESHGPAVGVVIDGVPPAIPLTEGDIQPALDRRRPGQSAVSTPRRESDLVEILSGTFDGKTTGTPLTLLIRNRQMRSQDYGKIKDLYRPGHGDYTWDRKYGFRDYRGGGRSSGRETAARGALEAVAAKALSPLGLGVQAWPARAAGISCRTFLPAAIEENPLRACDPEAAVRMEEAIRRLATEGNSAGGIIEARITGLPAGWGEPVFDKAEALLAHAMLSLGAVKGFEIGSGFAAADKTGLEQNDEMDSSGFLSNHAGGTLGGITSGQDLTFRIAVKPTPSISLEQRTRDTQGREQTISTQGRHDPCICPRLVPVVEAMTALVLADLAQKTAALSGLPSPQD